MLVADVVVSLALERDWSQAEIDLLARDVAELLDLSPDTVAIGNYEVIAFRLIEKIETLGDGNGAGKKRGRSSKGR